MLTKAVDLGSILGDKRHFFLGRWIFSFSGITCQVYTLYFSVSPLEQALVNKITFLLNFKGYNFGFNDFFSEGL